MTTLHANSPRDALARLENLILGSGLSVNHLSVRRQLAQAIDIVIHLTRDEDGQTSSGNHYPSHGHSK